MNAKFSATDKDGKSLFSDKSDKETLENVQRSRESQAFSDKVDAEKGSTNDNG